LPLLVRVLVLVSLIQQQPPALLLVRPRERRHKIAIGV
jgi:hypothetical protein